MDTARGRRSAGVALGVVLLALGTVGVVPYAAAAAPAAASSAASTRPGGFVALRKPVRVVDTRTGLHGNHRGAVAGGDRILPRVTGFGAVPRRGVGSVVLSLRALNPTASGGLVAYRSTRPATTNLRFTRGVAAVSTTAVVPVRSSGRIVITNQAAHGRVQIAADVVGYYRSGAASRTDHGVFHALPKAVRVDAATVRAGADRKVTIGGRAGIPHDAGAIAATVTADRATGGGVVTAWRQGDPRTALPAVRYRAREQVSGFAILGLGSAAVTLHNTGSHAVRTSIDVTGYYTEGVAQTSAMLRPVPSARIHDATVRGGHHVTVRAGGAGGVPLSRVRAAVVTVTVSGATGNSSLQVSRFGSRARTGSAAVSVRRGVTVTTTIIAPLSQGRFSLFNTATRSLRVAVDVHGYVPSDTLTPPRGDRGRYPNTLTGDVHYDSAALRDAGRADAVARSRFTLLDLGAQSVTAPVLSRARPGIVLALTKSRIALPYADVVTDVTAYLRAYAAAAPGVHATVAVGTNNDGVFDPKDPDYYTPASRGRDFAVRVIEPLRAAAPAGITVLGANDIESGFASDQYQALAWENAYLDATRADLVYNGSLDGCPTNFGGTSACAYGWTQAQYVGLTSNRGRVQVLPQVYIRDQSIQWANVDRASRSRLRYAGVLTESLDDDTFTPAQGWTAFVRALASVRTTPPTSGLRSVDIQPDTERR